MLRFLMWRALGLLATLVGLALIVWFLGGGPGRVLRGRDGGGGAPRLSAAALERALERSIDGAWDWMPALGVEPVRLLTVLAVVWIVLVVAQRSRVRCRRRYVRLRIEIYRTDRAAVEDVVRMFESLHKRLLRRWWRRLLLGQPSVGLEIHHAGRSSSHATWLAVTCPLGLELMIEAALKVAYPNSHLCLCEEALGFPPTVLRLKKHAEFINRVKALDRVEHEQEPPVNRLLTIMDACGEPAFVQLAMTPTPAFFEAFAKRMYKHREARLSRERREHLQLRDRSMVEDSELRGGLEIQHKALFFMDLRVIAPNRTTCERIASELRAESAENHLVERGTAIRHGLLGLYARRVQRGEGNPLPSFYKGVFAPSELAGLWQAPSVDYATVPFARSGVPLAPASPQILRPTDGEGTLRDALGPVSIHVELRKQNTAVPGTVEQGKSSYLVATVAEDVRRDRCAVIVLDPKGDAADAAMSVVPPERVCTLLDFTQPTCGFNPMAVNAPADVIADYVVAALKNLFTDADIRASSDRYLRNAIIAVLAYDRSSTLWDAARLLSVGEEGYSYRRAVGTRVRALPAFKEISEFFTAELSAQLADARSTTTAKLDAPVNKLARLLNSQSIKRVLLNDSLRVDFDRVIAHEEVLIVKGALGGMGAGNTSVLMQLLVGMLDAALARQQDLVSAHERVSVALKVDEAPLVLNRGFTETMALKRSAGLETVACWQTDAQWVDLEVREQLDALFAHRVYFATASARDARAAVGLTMAEFSDSVRPGIGRRQPTLGQPDVRLHLPKHHAIVSWSTAAGRQPPFIAQTIPQRVDRERLAHHAVAQHERGGRHRTDQRQPHWDRERAREGQVTKLDGSVPSVEGRAVAASASDVSVTETAESTEPRTPSESYRELVELDRAQSVRRAKSADQLREVEPDQLDLEMLSLIATFGHVLTSQVHRRFNRGRAATTTQRRLKRLSDAGLIERFQFHRRDGGGMPMCCTVTDAGLRMLEPDLSDHDRGVTPTLSTTNERRLWRARNEVHVAGWVLAVAGIASGNISVAMRGSRESVIHPPKRAGADGQVALALNDLQLPDGRAAHDFLRTEGDGRRVEVGRFETLRPDSTLALSGEQCIDLLVELDDRRPIARAAAKLERYDHFLTGWSVHTRRYGRRAEASALVVFVCRDRARARECARHADALLCACRAYAGEYPFDWEYPGRERILFVAERDAHDGLRRAYGVPSLPPAVRVAAAHGDPRAGEATVEVREIPDLSLAR